MASTKCGILVTASDGFDIDFVAADFLSERGEVRGSGHDLQLALGAGWRSANATQQCKGSEESSDASLKICAFHNSPKYFAQNGCAPCAPITHRN